jgi:hypothetical protein
VITILALLNMAESYLDISFEKAESCKTANERLFRLLHNIEDALK